MQNHLIKLVSTSALLILLTLLGTHQLHAAPQSGGILTVNSTGDGNSKSSLLSLYEAILISNGGTGPDGLNRTLQDGEKFQLSGCTFGGSTNNWTITGGCGAGMYDTIKFNLLGEVLHTISTNGEPVITDPVMIDGYSQPGSSPNTLPKGDNAVLLIELTGAPKSHDNAGLNIVGGNTTVQGLILNDFHPDYVEAVGIRIEDNGGNTIQGNFIGTNASANAPADFSIQRQYGILIDSSSNQIGGTSPAARNIISGNSIGIAFWNDPANQNIIQGNYIGTDKSGTYAIPNRYAMSLSKASVNIIGGTEQGAGNLISGNEYGIGISFDTAGNQILGNYIGLQADGIKRLGNTKEGINDASLSTIIGGSAKGSANRIAFNGGAGIVVSGSHTHISRNLIFGNSIGIDLNGDGVTPNHTGTPDPSIANNSQNFPTIQKATAATKTIKVSLNSAPNSTYTIEFFATSKCDGSGYGEGKKYLGSTTLTTNASGAATKTVTLSKKFKSKQSVTATATDSLGNTSEFSQCKKAN